MNIAPLILQSELIGLRARVVQSRNSFDVGISGKVLDETRNTLTIQRGEKEKMIAKETSVFHFTLSDRSIVEVDGKFLVGRPEDRIKKVMRRRW